MKSYLAGSLLAVVTLLAATKALAEPTLTVLTQNFSPLKCTPGWFTSGRFLRYSPGRVINESTGNDVWVSCPLDSLALGNVNVFLSALPTDLGNLNLTESSELSVAVVVKNEGPQPAEAVCQVKFFDRGGFETIKKTKIDTIASGRSKTLIVLDAMEYNFLDGQIGDLTCRLPPSSVMLRYYTDIGIEIDIPEQF